MSKFVKLALAFAFVLTMSAGVFAQSSTLGAIGGTVSNPSKELVPGAAVTVVNTETNQEATATTDDHGTFRIVNLQRGLYRVTINSAGFSPFSQEGVVVEVGRVPSLDVPLSIGPVSGGT